MKITKNIKEANAITHGGFFHADDVMSAVILSRTLDTELIVCRVNQLPINIPKKVIVFDIGGKEFDHHQKGGNGERMNQVPYASAGLIWRKFGNRLLQNFSDEERSIIWKRIDKELISGIDAVDNGVYPKPDYPITPMSISGVISSYNPSWDSDEDFDDAFLRATKVAGEIFDNCLKNAISDARAITIVEDAIEQSEDRILVFDRFVPWFRFLHGSKNPKAQDILFVVYPSIRGGYNWQCVTKSSSLRESRKDVPHKWWGESSEKLRLMTNVATATFCHQKGFVGGAELKEDAILLAKLAIEA